MTTTADHLTTVIRHWTDLADALGASTITTWPPAGLRAHTTSLTADEDEPVPLLVPDYPPQPIGVTAAPLRIPILDVMRDVEEALLDCADQTAAAVQYAALTPAPARTTWPAAPRARRTAAADDARRNALSLRQSADPRRWRYTGTRRTAPLAALWLLARVQGVRGPARPLDEQQLDAIGRVARTAAERVERALDLADGHRTLTRPCPCGGDIEVYGGAGASPCARCTGCGAIWSERGVIAA